MSNDYSVQPIGKDEYLVHKWDDGDKPITSYTVIIRYGFHCNCPSGKYRKYCAHTDMVKKYRKQERDSAHIEPLVMYFKKETK